MLREWLRKWLGVTLLEKELNDLSTDVDDLEIRVDGLEYDKADESYVNNEIDKLRSELEK